MNSVRHQWAPADDVDGTYLAQTDRGAVYIYVADVKRLINKPHVIASNRQKAGDIPPIVVPVPLP